MTTAIAILLGLLGITYTVVEHVSHRLMRDVARSNRELAATLEKHTEALGLNAKMIRLQAQGDRERVAHWHQIMDEARRMRDEDRREDRPWEE